MTPKTLLPFIFILFSFLSIFTQDNSGYVAIKKGELYYRIWGEGKPLLFLNGDSGFSSEGYEMYAEVLSKNRKRQKVKSKVLNNLKNPVLIVHTISDFLNQKNLKKI